MGCGERFLSRLRRRAPVANVMVLAVCTAALAACGGGGGGSAPAASAGTPSGTSGGSSGSSGGASGGGASTPTTWVQGQFEAQSTFAQMCVTPRTGVDPYTNKAYTDVQGTALDEKNWLRSWTHDLYLWFDEVVDQDPATFASDATYFAALKTTALTASGAAKDKFHFTYATPTWEKLSQSGVQIGYGADFVLIASTPPRSVTVAYTEPNTAASAAGGLARGDAILGIDGVDLVNATGQASLDVLNAGLSPQSAGETHTFTVQGPAATTSRTVTLVSADITSTPVQDVKTLTSASGTTVGYLLFNDQIATSEKALVDAVTQLQSAGVQDLVLDIRYNGGGYLDIASEAAYMIAGPAATAGQTFELTQFNSQHPTVDPVTGAAIVPTGFHTTTQGFSVTAGQALPTLGLSRVFVLTTADTCSASESIINGLRGVNVQVVEIGSTTCGKPYGFYPADNCAVTYFSIQFRGVNAQNFGDYSDGFTPANASGTQGVSIPGCAVADDYAHALGDPNEALLAAALHYQASGGSCPAVASGTTAGSAVSGTPAGSIKSFFRQNRLYRRGQAG